MITSLLFAAPARADENAELMHALQGLRGRITTTPTADAAAKYGYQLAAGAAAGVGVNAMLLSSGWISPRYLPPGLGNALMYMVTDQATYWVILGAAVFSGAYVYKAARWLERRGQPVDYHSQEGLNQFFALPVDQQYVVARPDSAFTKFLIQLNRSLDELTTGFTGASVRP